MRTRAVRATAAGVILLTLTTPYAPAQPPPTTASRPAITFQATRIAVDHVDQALEAVSLWQQFIDRNPASPDLSKAREELATWTADAAAGAERVNGKWIKGPDRDALIAKAADLEAQGRALLLQNTLSAIAKLEESFTLYPNSFSTAVLLGHTSLVQNHYDEATTYLERALALQPNSPDVLNNLAFIYYHQRKYEPAILDLYKSLQISDDHDRAQNLVTVISDAPPGIRRNPKLRPAIDAANLLKAKYNLTGRAASFTLVPPPSQNATPTANSPRIASATGFLVTPDGYILTNRHVVLGAKTILVLLPGGKQSSAELTATDSQNDLAILHIKTDVPLPHLQFADDPCPVQGTECTVLGYPLIDRLGPDPKITGGLISGPADPAHASSGADLLLDAKINPGDSGGPVFDAFGHVIAVVCQKSRTANPTEDSYGLAISAGRARKFLDDNHVDTQAPPPVGPPLPRSQIAATVKPGTVCILVTY